MGKVEQKETCHLPDNSVTPWHIDLAYIDKIYYLVIYDYDTNNLVLYSSSDGLSFNNKNIYYPKLQCWVLFIPMVYIEVHLLRTMKI